MGTASVTPRGTGTHRGPAGGAPASYGDRVLTLTFTGEVVHWRGPAPHHFVEVPAEEVEEIHAVAGAVTYGWGMVPATVTVGGTSMATAIFPRDGGYLVPLKVALRRAEGVGLGDVVTVTVAIASP